MSEPLRFLIVQDYKENRRKCTALPLRARPDFEFIRLGRPLNRESPLELPGGLLLDIDAPVLTRGDRDLLSGDDRVVVLDASWARLKPLSRRVRSGASLHGRSLPSELRSAYPRHSKLYRDPSGGLATVEAIFSATVVLGAPRMDVLEGYRWSAEFLELNGEVFSNLSRSRA